MTAPAPSRTFDPGPRVVAPRLVSSRTAPEPDPEEPCATTTEVVRAAAAHDPRAWEELVARYRGMVRGVVASYRLSEADAADAVQNTWMRAVERLDTVRDPERLGGWLATTARRECLAVLRHTSREVAGGLMDGETGSSVPGPESAALAQETRRTVRRAVAQLPNRRRALVSALFATPDTPYADVARTLDVPVGSIGPTRARVLRALRCTLEGDGLDAGSVA